MNISELARKLKINTEDLREKLPELGFDIGKKAIKVDNALAGRIMNAWRGYQERAKLKEKYTKISEKKDTEKVVDGEKIEIPSVLTVKDFSILLNLSIVEAISELMRNGVMASMNQRIDFDTAAIIATDLGYEPVEINLAEKIEIDKHKRIKEKLENESNLTDRPPVIVVMGHVDHGKTKLLDAIRSTDVVSGESGGITQHIGAYQVEKKNRKITFIDTPGHEAFSAMRSRGAKVADIAILVVAANDGVKPQTIESIKIAQDAGIPIIVAINKIDLPAADPERTKQELSQYNLLPEEWGGKTICVPISAKFNKNIDALLDNVLLVADMNEDKIKANAEGDFIGAIIESHINPGAGPIATILVKNGTLRIGDYISVDGVLYGKIKVMRDYTASTVKAATPSMPVEVLGLKVAPKVGDILEKETDPKNAKKIKIYAMKTTDETFIKPAVETKEDDEGVSQLNIVIKSDVLGSQEAIIESLKKIETDKVKIKFVSRGLGSVTESDILNAEATGAVIYGFNSVLPLNAARLADEKKVDVKLYSIIYELIDDAKERMNKVLKPELVREDVGKLQVLKIFKKGDKSQIVGGKVIEGKIEPGSQAAIFRGEEFITGGKLTELQVGKQVVTDVEKGQECGLTFIGQPLIEEGDVLDVYKEREILDKI